MSTWETHELPVLRVLAEHFSEPGAAPLKTNQIVARVGFDEPVVKRVLRVLSESRPPYVLGVQQDAGPVLVTGLTDRAQHELEQADLKDEAQGRTAENPPRRRGPLPPGALAQG